MSCTSISSPARFALLSSGAMLFAFYLSAVLAEDNVRPGINQHYQDPDFGNWVSVFETEGREVYDQRHAIIEALKIRPGMDIADVGAGTGLFTRLFARKTGKTGTVYAVDIAENFVSNILRTGKEQGLTNIVGIVNNQKDTLLPANSVDMVFISDTYHHFEYPVSTLTSIRKALRPGGRLAVIDFRKQHGTSSGWVLSHVRAGRDQVVAEVNSAGFRLVQEPELLRENYFLIFIKDDGANQGR